MEALGKLFFALLLGWEFSVSLGFITPRIGGGQRWGSPSQMNLEEASGDSENEYFYSQQLHPNTQSEILTCSRVDDKVASDNGMLCPRGWNNAPLCNYADKRDFGSCERVDDADFELAGYFEQLKAISCKNRKVSCMSDSGVISSDIQLLHFPRNALSDRAELAETLSHLLQLVVVNFARNNFRYLSEKTFECNPYLASVNFDLNFLFNIPEKIFYKNKRLISVSFVGNKLDYLPTRLFYWNPYLMVADFERNNITLLPWDIFRRNKRLQVIRLSGNLLPHIHKGLFSANYNLQELTLSNNRIKIIPKLLFSNNRNLRNLYLSGNAIEKIPGHLFDNCAELRTVKLDGNMISTLPARLFYKNPKLTYVDLSYNRFHIVSPDIFSNAATVSVVNKQWDKQTGVLEAEEEDGEWNPLETWKNTFYRKSQSG